MRHCLSKDHIEGGSDPSPGHMGDRVRFGASALEAWDFPQGPSREGAIHLPMCDISSSPRCGTWGKVSVWDGMGWDWDGMHGCKGNNGG